MHALCNIDRHFTDFIHQMVQYDCRITQLGHFLSVAQSSTVYIRSGKSTKTWWKPTGRDDQCSQHLQHIFFYVTTLSLNDSVTGPSRPSSSFGLYLELWTMP
jgi:hypothetical protein